jgi:hypothetical protein
MQLNAQDSMERRRLTETSRQFNRQQSEIERNNLATNAYNQGMLANQTRTTDFNTGGNVDLADNDALAQGQTLLTSIDAQIQALDKTSPNYAAHVAALQQRRKAIAGQIEAARKSGRGGISGAMKIITPEIVRPFGRDGHPAQGGVSDYATSIVDRVNRDLRPKANPAPAAAGPVSANPEVAAPVGLSISPYHVLPYESAEGITSLSLPSGTNLNDLNLFPGTTVPNATGINPAFATTLGGRPIDLSSFNFQTPYEAPKAGDPEYYVDEAATPEFQLSQQPKPKRVLNGYR